MATVRDVFRQTMRELRLTTVFGNPGSTEEPFLRDFPPDFEYVLALQEASVVAMADGYSQQTNRPAFVQLHTSGGVSNALGRNSEYAILKSFARELDTPAIPGLDLPGIDTPAIAHGYGCPSSAVDDPADLESALRAALARTDGPHLLQVTISSTVPPLL